MPLRADVASGATLLYDEDLRLPGYLPLVLARRYRSDNTRKGPFGVGWTFNYDIALHLGRSRITYRDASDREVFFRPIEVGMQVVHPETGYTLEHHHDAYVITRTPSIKQVFLKRNALADRLRLDRVEDRSGHALQLVYKGPHLIAILDTVGRQVQFTYTADRVTTLLLLEEGGGRATPLRTYQYDAQGDLVAALDAAKRPKKYAYQNHLMVAYTNRLGGVQYAQYDKKHRCIALWRSDRSQVRLLAYDDLRQTTRVTDTNGTQTIYRHLMGQRVQVRVDPLGKAQEYYYDEQEQLFGFTTTDGTVAALHQFDPDAGTLGQIDGQERIAFFTFNEAGLAEQVADGYDNAYTLAYDERGTLVRMETPLEAAWLFGRDDQGRVTEVTSPEGRTVRLRYDKSRTRTVEDDFGLRYTETYDGLGRLRERVDSMDRRERRTYNEAGRLTTVKIDGAYEVRFSYDAAGNLTGATDSRRRDFKMRYDAFGRLLARTDPDGRRWQFQYDGEGRLVAATDGSGSTARYSYDAAGRLAQVTTLEGSRVTYRYEPGGMVVEQQEGREAVRAYTPLADLADETLPDGTQRRFTYGPSGELLTALEGDKELVFVYDAEGRVEAIQDGETAITFTYDGEGKLRTVEGEPGSRFVLRYDRRGRLEVIQEDKVLTCSFSYDKGERATALLLPDGHRLVLTYDLLDRVQERHMEHQRTVIQSHRFRTKDQRVLVDPLLRPAGVTPEDTVDLENAWGQLYQTRYGLVLGVQIGTRMVPLWAQDYYFAQGEQSMSARIVAAALDGIEEPMRRRGLYRSPELLGRWMKEAQTGLRYLHSEAPSARDIGLPWHSLDAFFLRRPVFDADYPHRMPGYLAHHQVAVARAGDAALTGSHMVGYLAPEPWPGRVMQSERLPAALRLAEASAETATPLFTPTL